MMMKLFSQTTRALISLGLKTRSRKWPEDYYIYRDGDRLLDSMGNVFSENWEEYIRTNQHILNNAGPIWEIYEEVDYINL
jgi:hypothetical protein